MRLVLGVVVGAVAYAAWTLSQPAPGESADLQARIERLKQEWNAAVAQGKVAGDATRQRMEVEFNAILKR